ncbi:MAG: hypothetical protein ACE5G1_13265, partial [bacterium]
MPRTKISPVLGLAFTLFVTILGMLSVYVAGNARGYDPSFAVLIRNTLLMAVFFVVYFILKRSYKGDFSFLVVVALLTGIGFVVQYRISSAINVDFQEIMVRQYSAAFAKSDGARDSLQTAQTDSSLTAAEQERSLHTIQKEAEQFLKLDQLKFGQILGDFFRSFSGWSRLIISHIIALFLVVYLVRRCSTQKFMNSLSRPFFWVTLTVLLLMVFVALSEVKTRGRFVYQMTPWEAFKVTIIIFLAGFFAKYKDDFTREKAKIKGKVIQRL